MQVAYDRDDLPAGRSQNQLEEDALAAVIRALPLGVHPVILADRGFARATFLQWLQQHSLDYVVRIDKGTCITELDGQRWKLGEEAMELGEVRFHPVVRYGLYTASIMTAPATCTRIWPSCGACRRRTCTAVSSARPPSSRSSRGIWRPTSPPPPKRSPGIANGSGLRKASRTPSRASASSTRRLAAPSGSHACSWR
jgi:hypothetical protein